MCKEVKIICTIGPASKDVNTLRKFELRNVSMIRINLSHILQEDIEDYIHTMQKCNIPIAIDTEGTQIRTGTTGARPIYFKNGDTVRIHRSAVACNSNNLYFTPFSAIDCMVPGNLVAIDFNSVLIRVEDVSKLKTNTFIECRVIVEGFIGSNKGVHCDGLQHVLPPFSEKDLQAIEIAKKNNIRHFTLSFINDAKDVVYFKSLCPDSTVYAKIETLQGVKNIVSILKESNGVLIDRGDLSRAIPIEKIPLVQKIIVETANIHGKEAYIATNLLESMARDLKPSRAEATDIVNAVIDGVSGFVLTKETAVGKYPVETVNMLNSLIHQAKIGLTKSRKTNDLFTTSLNLSYLKEIDYHCSEEAEGSLVQPHGGKLIGRYMAASEEVEKGGGEIILEVNDNVLMDMDQIGIGTYSPLEGFMCRNDFQHVLNEMRLKNGTVWTLPIILAVTEEEKEKIKHRERIRIASRQSGEIHGILDVEDIYRFDKSEYARKIFGTEDVKHPGVKMLKETGEYIIGGRIKLMPGRNIKYRKYNLTPKQLRSIFSALGWAKVVGFHTRNVIHRSHEYIQYRALEETGCDGLFVHPIIGSKKKGDFSSEIIIQSYEIMIEKYYPKNKVVFSLFSTYSRYAGPREAIFTALCRQNFGCSHFIVGRDHTGVKNFYAPVDSQKIFGQFKDINIVPVVFDEVGYSTKMERYITVKEAEKSHFMNISGTEIRNMLNKKVIPPDWCMRPDISRIIIEKLSNGEKVFV